MRKLVIALVAVAGYTVPWFATAIAQTPAYVGAYTDAESCAKSGGQMTVRLKAKSASFYDENFCTFTRVDRISGNVWTAHGKCRGEGMSGSYKFRIEVRGSKNITIKDVGNKHTLNVMRCAS